MLIWATYPANYMPPVLWGSSYSQQRLLTYVFWTVIPHNWVDIYRYFLEELAATIFHLENGNNRFLRKIGGYLPKYTSHPRKPHLLDFTKWDEEHIKSRKHFFIAHWIHPSQDQIFPFFHFKIFYVVHWMQETMFQNDIK